jgi:medium-chain acyl-[acyl-carrier-protein] hydrolase
MREPPFDNLDALVQDAVPMMLPYLDRPFAFFGHSMGAIICFEIARHLRKEQLGGPLHLFVSGRRAPQRPASRPPTYDLPEPEFLKHLQHLDGTPKEVLEHPQLMQLMLPLLRADFSVSQTYAHREGPPLDCPITAFGGERDDEVSREDLEAWREQTTASFSLRMFPGGHFFLHSSQTEMLGIITRGLLKLTERGSIVR